MIIFIKIGECLCTEIDTAANYNIALSLQEKIEALQTLGADVRPVPVVPWTDQENYNHQVQIV